MRCEDVWLRYHRRGPWVLRATSVGIGPGEAAVVLGRNGVGKSTLLQLAAGVLRPTRGRVVDRPRRVGWVPERFPADQPFTVRRYLTGMARVAGLGPAEAGPAADRWVERLGLTGFRDVRLPELSKGTAQKVGLAQAMLRRPGLLVLDEPWEGLDAAARELVPALIDEVLAAGGSVLISDHRGETVRLPRAARWTVSDGTVTAEGPSAGPGGPLAVVEIAVPAARVAHAVARLRADGHHVLRVRSDAAPPDAPVPPGEHPAVGSALAVDTASAAGSAPIVDSVEVGGGSVPPTDEQGAAVRAAEPGRARR
ncbi:ATP-binding cassette domain-containing protein [Micromonospora olivasterospora]|uniref:ABC transporter family protein n=1 Tax=Micromonospora olivasterospora TaxID=1880 RepID=A0A562I6L4_MICOL|nr:ATP-binding cassette domain-containing protein [Micromonospora olivasterospora]TWH66639.1 ABC transporter family protein [Micromonospora olivasterospora]